MDYLDQFESLDEEVQKALLRGLLERTSAMIYVKDREGKYLMANRETLDHSGQSPGEFFRIADADLFSTRTADQLRANDLLVIRENRSLQFEETLRRDEEVRVVLSEKCPLTGKDGRSLGLLGISTDITARKRLERRLNFSARARTEFGDAENLKDSFKELAQAAVPSFADICTIDLVDADGLKRDLVYHTDDDFTSKELEAFKKWPPRSEDAFGAGYILGSKKPQLVPKVTDEMLRRTAQSEEHYHYLSQLEIRSLISLPLKVRGELVGIMSLILYGNHAEYSKDDLELAQVLASKTTLLLNNSLLLRDAQREIVERDKIQSELEMARDRSLDHSRAKTDFLARVSHEIRTPMTGIVGILDLLHLDDVSDTVREKLDVVDECVSSLLEIVSDILDIAQVESGKIVLRSESFDPRTVALRTRALYEATARKKGLHIDLVVDKNLRPAYLGDSGRVGQILGNFVSNAIKYTLTGFIRVNISHQAGLRLEVSDSGVGLTEAQREALFQPFERVGAEQSLPEVVGAGLGLTITREFARRMGGEVGVTSEVGVGSTFFCQLPLQQTEDVDSPPLLLPDDGNLRTAKILVVEDNSINLRVLSRQLEGLHHQVFPAANGREALDILDQQQVDLVFMDCQMPIMNGFEATKEIRTRKLVNRDVAIVALTADAFQAQKERCLAAGMSDFLTKPCSTKDLDACLRKWLLQSV